MKRLLCLLLVSAPLLSTAQITIAASDMPVAGDTLRHSIAAPVGTGINVNDSGANKTWAFVSLTAIAQGLDAYRTALSVDPAYLAYNIPPTAYGYKVTDSLPLPGTIPVSVKDLYTFFNKKNNPSRYVAEGFGAKVSGLLVGAPYINEDTIYKFPLAYGNMDTSEFYMRANVPTIGTYVQSGTRITKVDGWGTITTPYFTAPTNCIRVRSEVNEVDSVKVSSLPAFGIPRTYVDYKWLVNGEHYPALWVTTTKVGNTETISSVRYREKYIPTAVNAVENNLTDLKLYPNPASGGYSTLSVPGNWKVYTVDVYDVQGKLVNSIQNNNRINTADLADGTYIVRVSSGASAGFIVLVKE